LDFDLEQIDQFFSNVMIEGRYFALPLESVYHLPTWETTVNTGIEVAVNLATATVYSLLERAGLAPEEVSQITSATLIPAVPSIDARLMNHIQ
jgi:alkylresorcinol/alkylpyrone synthase